MELDPISGNATARPAPERCPDGTNPRAETVDGIPPELVKPPCRPPRALCSLEGGPGSRSPVLLRDVAAGRTVRITFKEKDVVARGRALFAYDFATKRSWELPLATGLRTGDSDDGWLRVDAGRVFASTSWKRRGRVGELHVIDLASGKPVF